MTAAETNCRATDRKHPAPPVRQTDHIKVIYDRSALLYASIGFQDAAMFILSARRCGWQVKLWSLVNTCHTHTWVL